MTDPQIDLAHLARLAGLETPEDEARLRAQLERVLGYVAQLNALELEDDGATEGPVELVLRPDEPGETLSHARAMEIAVESVDDFFRVPPVMPDRSS